KQILRLFFLFFARLALLCFAKIGCGSEEKKQILRLFFLFFARLALSLPPISSKSIIRQQVEKFRHKAGNIALNDFVKPDE
ncbi:MAG: hypothetical protein MR605_08445, partial [Bacteroidales bacterium]|nr:hypothetical protein [Bacteroidales bacterium]